MKRLLLLLCLFLTASITSIASANGTDGDENQQYQEQEPKTPHSSATSPSSGANTANHSEANGTPSLLDFVAPQNNNQPPSPHIPHILREQIVPSPQVIRHPLARRNLLPALQQDAFIPQIAHILRTMMVEQLLSERISLYYLMCTLAWYEVQNEIAGTSPFGKRST